MTDSYPVYDTKLHLMANFVEYGVASHWHYFQVHSDSKKAWRQKYTSIHLEQDNVENTQVDTNSQKKINHLMYMDEIKLFAKNEKELENLIQTVRIYNQGWDLASKNAPC